MLVQSLVDNAIKLTASRRCRRAASCAWSARIDGPAVEIVVANSGVLFARAPQGKGYGLTNAQERLRLFFYDGSASLTFRQEGPMTVAELRRAGPIRTQETPAS